MSILPYMANSSCPKCGQMPRDQSIKFHPAKLINCKKIPDHLCITCVCGFAWCEEPKDVAEKRKAEEAAK